MAYRYSTINLTMENSSPSQCHLFQLLRNRYAERQISLYKRNIFANNIGLYINSQQENQYGRLHTLYVHAVAYRPRPFLLCFWSATDENESLNLLSDACLRVGQNLTARDIDRKIHIRLKRNTKNCREEKDQAVCRAGKCSAQACAIGLRPFLPL